MKSLVAWLTSPLIRLAFRVSESRQLSRPVVVEAEGKSLSQLIKEIR